MMKKWIWIVWAVMAVVTALSITAASLEGAHRRSLAKQVKEQSVIIDSLLTLYSFKLSANKIHYQ